VLCGLRPETENLDITSINGRKRTRQTRGARSAVSRFPNTMMNDDGGVRTPYA